MNPIQSAKKLSLPLAEHDVRNLHVGDFVLLSGKIYTARDAVHRHLASGASAPCPLAEGILYHCGPVVVRDGDAWKMKAAGPTTSIREEPYMAALIAKYKLRGIIGKGGMGPQTLEACGRFGCVYLHAVGGAAQVLAARVKEIPAVHLRERFGDPEAIWELVVEDFPVMVTMDCHGQSLHADIEETSQRELDRLVRCS